MIKKAIIILLLLTLAGLFLRIYPFSARSWVMDYDTQMVSQSLDLGKSIIEKKSSPWPEDVKYPYFIPYLLLVCYGIFYLIGALTGLFNSAAQFTNFIFLHLNQFYWYSRILIAIFGALSIPLAYLTIRQLFDRGKEEKVVLGALLAAFLTAFSLLSIQFSQQIRPHLPVAVLILLSFYFYLLFLKSKKTSHFLLLAAAIGLAVGAFHGGIFAFVFLILAHYFTSEECAGGFNPKQFLKSFISFRFIIGLLIFLVVASACYPYMFTNLKLGAVGEESSLSLSVAGATFFVAKPGGGLITVLRTIFFYEFSLGILLILFLLFYIFKRKREEKSSYYRQALIGWWAFILPYTLIFILLDDGTRYRLVIPVVLFLCLGAAILFVRIFDYLKDKKLIILLIVILLSFEAVQAVRLVQLMKRPYARDRAVEWINKNISSRELIVFRKTLPNIIPTKKSIETEALFRDNVLSRQNRFLLTLDESYFKDSKTIIDFKSVLKYKEGNVGDINEFIKKIKPSYFVLTSRSMDLEPEESDYQRYQIFKENGRLIKRFTPLKDKDSLRSLNFPSGMDNPIIDLWVSNRLGPIVEVYKLNWQDE